MGTRVAAWFEAGPFDRRQLVTTPAGQRLLAALDHHGFEDVMEGPAAGEGVATFYAWDYEANYGTEAFKGAGLPTLARAAGLWWAMGTAGGPTWLPSVAAGSPEGWRGDWTVDTGRMAVAGESDMDRLLAAAGGNETRAWRALRLNLSRGRRALSAWIAAARPPSSAARPTTHPGDSSTAPDQPGPSPAAYFATDERRTVRVPGSELHLGLDVVELSVRWACPVCGGPRGDVHHGESTDEGCGLDVAAWENPCGHDDLYAAVRAEARVDALVGEATPADQAQRVNSILAELAEQITETTRAGVEGQEPELSLPSAHWSLLVRHRGSEGLARWARDHHVRIWADPLLGDDTGTAWIGLTRITLRPLVLNCHQGEVYTGLVRDGLSHTDAIAAALAIV